MDFNWKVIIFIAIIGGMFWLNSRYNNFIIRFYNQLSQFPKLALIGVGVMAICAPFLLKDNSLLNHFSEFMPDSMSSQLNLINQYKQNNIRQNQSYVKTGTTKDRRHVSEQLKKKIAAEQAWKCRHCGSMLDAKYEVDHIVALEDGGGNDIMNLQALCRNCHGQKTLSDDIKRKYPGGRL